MNRVLTLRESLDRDLVPRRFASVLLSSFAGLALVLALVGTSAAGGVIMLCVMVWRHGIIRVFGTLLRRLGSALFPGWVRPRATPGPAPSPTRAGPSRG